MDIIALRIIFCMNISWIMERLNVFPFNFIGKIYLVMSGLNCKALPGANTCNAMQSTVALYRKLCWYCSTFIEQVKVINDHIAVTLCTPK